MNRSRFQLLAAAGAALALAGCIALTVGDVQAFRLFFTLDEVLADGEQVEAHSSVFPAEVKVRRNFVKIFGRLAVPAGAPLPDRVEVDVVLASLATQQPYYTFRLTLPIAGDGSFGERKRFLRQIGRDTLQTVLVRPIGASIPRNTRVALCVEVSKKKADLSATGTCVPGGGGGGGGGGGNVAQVQVLDNSFEPRSVQIQAGDTVRWVRAGASPSHTVTEEAALWDSGLTFATQGSTFERQFGAGENNQTFLYYCRTHQACCAMQGSVVVGNGPGPDPGYE
ncbi:MAG: cupredoxin domain-containing protein [Thermoanaerobaculia bacterium]